MVVVTAPGGESGAKRLNPGAHVIVLRPNGATHWLIDMNCGGPEKDPWYAVLCLDSER